MSTIAEHDTIMLNGGFTVPVDALTLVWRLEEMGIQMCVDGDALVLRPQEQIPLDDLPLLRKYRQDVMRMLVYHAEPPV